MSDLIILNCGGYNLASLQFALDRINVSYAVSNDLETVKNANRIILPGVGTAHNAMMNIEKFNLKNALQEFKRPLLGICLGQQLLFENSSEISQDHKAQDLKRVECLNILKGSVLEFHKNDKTCPSPHMGWNALNIIEPDNPLFKGIPNDTDLNKVYFVHSFFTPFEDAQAKANPHTVAYCDYQTKIIASAHRDNFFGCQFHPEKSGKIGSQILQNFTQI